MERKQRRGNANERGSRRSYPGTYATRPRYRSTNRRRDVVWQRSRGWPDNVRNYFLREQGGRLSREEKEITYAAIVTKKKSNVRIGIFTNIQMPPTNYRVFIFVYRFFDKSGVDLSPSKIHRGLIVHRGSYRFFFRQTPWWESHK